MFIDFKIILIDLIGYIGLFLILFSFILYELGKIDNKSKKYNMMNLIGASILALYAFHLRIYVFTILNIIWAFFAFYKLTKITNKTK